MIRDPGPLHNLGSGVTSRDVPINEGEQEGSAPNSSFISRALGAHPVMRFVATTAATMLAAGIVSKVTKQGGLKLVKFVEDRATSSTGLTSQAISSAKNLRKMMDEFQGVHRFIDSEIDPYSKLVFEKGNKLTTGYDGITSERFGFGYMTKEERRMAGNGILGEPEVMWNARNEFQQRMVRAGRRLPYELPAFYIGQKAVTDPIFGENDPNKRKVKWYNPVDVVADFTKESVKSIATMILPFEAAGAAGSVGKSSLHTLRYSMTDIRNLTPMQQKMHKGFVNVTEVLAEVGHDFAGLTNKFLKKSAQTSGAFNAAAEEFRIQENGFVQTLDRLKHGVKEAKKAEIAKNSSREEIKKAEFNAVIKGYKSGTEEYSSVWDLIPAFRGIKSSMTAARKEYTALGEATKAMDGALARNKVLNNVNGMFHKNESALDNAIQRIQSQHSSRLSRLASGVRILGGGGPGSATFTSGQFSQGMQDKAFKDLLEQQLISKNIAAKDASQFVNHLDVTIPKSNSHATKTITIGKSKIYETDQFEEGFFDQIIKRYQGIRGSDELINNPNFNADALERSVRDAKAVFTGKEYQKRLNRHIESSWNKFYRDDLQNAASTILKPKKAIYQDFIGNKTNAKLDFLQRKTAQTLGIDLVDANGRMLADDIVKNKLRERAIDPNNFTDLRAFLIKNKKMTSGVFSGGYNLFGMQQVTIDEARQTGMFKHMRDDEQKIISDIAGRMAINDPVSKSIGMSRLDGVYRTKSGEILDFTSVKSTFSRAANFFASEFKIPILGFNPADLFGYNSFSEMAKRSPIQFVSSRSVQPFLGDGVGSRADFYIWHQTRGTKGKVTAFHTDQLTSKIKSTEIEGTYRALPTNTSDLLTRHTRYGSAGEGKTVEEIRGRTSSRFLNRLLGDSPDGGRALSFKQRAAIDAEQPNSIFGFLSRFQKRSYDLENRSVMAKLLSGEEVVQKTGKTSRKLRLENIQGSLRVVDDAGQVAKEFAEKDILGAYHGLLKDSFQYGMPKPVMKQLEQARPDLFTFKGRTVSSLSSEKEVVELAEGLLGAQGQMAIELRAKGLDPTAVLSSSSRIKSLMNSSNLSSVSMMSQKSPTITTRLDELKNEIFRYIAQTNQLNVASSSDDIFVEIQKAVSELVKSGKISSAQKAEAQAAGLSTMFNISAFRTFRHTDSNISSARQAAAQLFEYSTKSGGGTSGLFDPFTKGEIAQVSSSIRKKFSPLLSPVKRKFGTAGYSPDDLAIDPLGSGQYSTLVPTFKTSLNKRVVSPDGTTKSNVIPTLKNAFGFTTYSDPSGFSTGSIPISQGVERLNRYFGTVGLQLDVSQFKGPLDLFARGMVGKRVLPLYAAGTTALTIDRTLGGMVHGKDDNGERIYAPLITGQVAKGAVQLQAAAAGLIPGGMSYEEKRQQLVEGEVPIRQGRFWPLGNTPFKGGKIMYYRPSWYRRLQGGAMFTSDTYGSPAEKLLFYNDISPLRPLDPYRFERKHYYDRPYPVTGEYFTGPFGPITPLANLTVGKILKPKKMMHEEEVKANLATYAPAGEFGSYDPAAYSQPSSVGGPSYGYGGMAGSFSAGRGGFGSGPSFGFGTGAGGMQSASNARLASMAGSLGTAKGIARESISNVNAGYTSMSYGPPKVSRVMSPRVVPSGAPIAAPSTQFQLGELGYKTQEMLGIYGFAGGSLRQAFGFGQSDFEPQRSVLQSASKAYGTSRAFWDLNLGGLGDVPFSGPEGIGNIEFSEIVRRFIPKERSGVDYINPIQNTMGQKHTWLPGAEYYLNFKTGDPFTKVQEGELRLPGVGYERFNKLHPDQTGSYGLIDQLKILGDVAPYSQQLKSVNSQINKMNLTPNEKIEVEQIRSRIEDVTHKYEFSEYKYKGASPEIMGQHPIRFSLGRVGEYLAHSDNFILSKAVGKRTALEDWERNNVYGTTFPQWNSPIESYISPMINKATQRNPLVASATLAGVGALFGRTPRARLFGTALGAATGLVASVAGNTYEAVTGDRFIPEKRKKELALEEYSDILNYVKNTRLASMAESSGDMKAAAQYTSAAGRTMYGANIYSKNIDMLSLSVPKRKREHFKAMINAPEEDRSKILSTAGRLERRLYEAAWGMDVEKLPDLQDYFTRHELPDESWEGWHPNTNVDHVKIKTGQHMGLDMSQMGYYPQQIKEANLANPSYPDFYGTNDKGDVSDRLRALMSGMGLTGSVSPSINPFGSQKINFSAGVR